MPAKNEPKLWSVSVKASPGFRSTARKPVPPEAYSLDKQKAALAKRIGRELVKPKKASVPMPVAKKTSITVYRDDPGVTVKKHKDGSVTVVSKNGKYATKWTPRKGGGYTHRNMPTTA